MEINQTEIPAIEYHADDFGMFLRQSQRIMVCQEQGRLNGVSIMPNGEALDECLRWLAQRNEAVAVTIHLNLIEGTCLSSSAPKLGLTDEAGNLQARFANLLLHSFLPGRAARKNWLKQELAAQIQAVASRLPEGCKLRLDGHAHYHMIPVVFDAMMEVIQENNWKVCYIRNPREYPMLYLRNWHRLQDFSLINLAKVCILNLLYYRNQLVHRRNLVNLEKKIFLGVFFSGRMYRANVDTILPDAIRLAKKKNRNLEILAHPGGVEEPEDIAKITSPEDLAFLTDPLRRKEADLFLS